MKVCPVCGKDFPDDVLFCDECGNALVEKREPVVYAQPVEEVPAEEVPVEAPAAPAEEFAAAAFEAPAEEPAAPAEPIAPAEPAQPAKQNSGKKKGFKPNKKLIVIAAAVVVVLVAVIALLAGGGKKDKAYPLAGQSIALYIKDGEINYSTLKGKPLQVTEKLADDSDNRDFYNKSFSYGSYYRFTDDGKYLLFADKNGNLSFGSYDLYMRKLSDKKGDNVKIGSGITRYEISEDSAYITYLTDSDVLYRYNVKKSDAEKYGKEVSSFRVSADGKTVLFRSDDTWYLQQDGKDKEKLFTGTLEYCSDDFKTFIYLDDGVLYKRVAGKDKEKLVSDVGGALVIDEKTIYYIEEAKNGSGLYYLGGKKGSAILEDIDLEDFDYTENGSVMLLVYYDSKDKLTAAVLKKGELVMEDTLGKTNALSYCDMNEEGTRFYVVNGDGKLTEYEIGKKEFTETDISVKDVSYAFYRDGKLYTESKYNNGCCTLSVDGEEIAAKVYSNIFKDDAIYYLGDYSEKHSTCTLCVYKNGKTEELAEDVYARIFFTKSFTDNIYYFKDYNVDKSEGTLCGWINGKEVEIGDDISSAAGYAVVPDGGVLYLADYSTKRYEGDLYYFNGKKSAKIDEDVCAILPIY